VAKYYPKTIIRSTIGARRIRLMKAGASRLAKEQSAEDISSQQLALFNKRWSEAVRLPFYQDWKRLHSLPERISDISDLDNWPVLTKDSLRNRQDLVDLTPNVAGHYTTSGSTGEPFRFPRGKIDFHSMYEAQWSYRALNGLQPFDSFVFASNTLNGAGISSVAHKKNSLVRIAKDYAGNSAKVNGFLASDYDADSAIGVIEKSRPRYLVGYPSAISAIARRSSERGIRFPSLSHAILTSESIDPSDISAIRELLDVHVLIEYGTAELGTIAGTVGSPEGWPVRTIWWNSLVRLDGEGSAILTSLSPRTFPLINFSISDALMVGRVGPGGTALTIDDVRGRTRDVVSVLEKDGSITRIMARQLVYLVRESPGVRAVQVTQRRDGYIDFIVTVGNLAAVRECARSMSESIRRNRPEYEVGTVRARFVTSHIPGARGKRSSVIPIESVPADAPTIDLL